MEIFKKEDFNWRGKNFLNIVFELKNKNKKSSKQYAQCNQSFEWVESKSRLWRTVSTLLNGMDIKTTQVRPIYSISQPIVLLAQCN